MRRSLVLANVAVLAGALLTGVVLPASTASAAAAHGDASTLTTCSGTSTATTITISGCPGNGSASSTVEMHITNGGPGDLIVYLRAPDFTMYLLHANMGSEGDIHETNTVDLSSEPRDGTWRLWIRAAQRQSNFALVSWTLTL